MHVRPDVLKKWVAAGAAILLALVVLAAIPADVALRGPERVYDLALPALPPELQALGATLEVTVRAAATHEPIAGARLRALAMSNERAYLSGTVTTDEEGHAHLGPLPTGEHWLVADAAGYARGSTHLLLLADRRSVEMELGEPHHLEVTVKDEHGEPVAGAEIEALGAEPLAYGGRAGAGGVATLDRLGPPPWRVTVRAPGYEDALVRGAKDGENLAVTLRKLGGLVVKVVGDAEQPAQGARVHISGASLWPARSTDTDAAGEARIGGLGTGSYALRATLGEDCSPIELGVMITRGEEKSVTLHLGPCRRVVVKVVDGEGDDARPVALASVSLVESGISPFPFEGRTGKDGRVSLGPIAPGRASVSARAEGFVPRGAIDVPEPMPKEVVVSLVRAGTLIGRVTDSRGFAVDGATIEIVGTDFFGAPIADSPQRTRFREAHFEATLKGPERLLSAGELGVVPGAVPAIPHAAQDSPPPPAPAPTAATAFASAPPPSLTLAPLEPWVTRRDGTFRAAPASPGRVRVLVHHPEYVEAWSDLVTLTAGGEVSVDVVMFSGGHLEGRVLDARGSPVDNVRVAVAATKGSFERSMRVATDGTFAFSAVPDSISVSVAFEDDPTQVLTRMHVDIPEHERKSITITLPEARPPLPATVRDDRGYPIEAAQLSARALDPQTPLRATVFTNRRGEAELPSARGLPLRVEVTAQGQAPKVVHVAADALALDVVLGRAESLEGEVRSSRNDPIEGAEVVLSADYGARRARTNAAGTFSLDGLAPGPIKLRVRAAGFAPTSRDVTIPDAHGDRPFSVGRLELETEGSVEGTVLDRRGDPITGARVAVDRVPTYLVMGRPPPGVAISDANGRFTLSELPEGEIALEAFFPDVGRARVQGVKVTAGRPTIGVRIVLEKTDDAKAEASAASGGVAVTLGETSEPREVVIVAVAEGSAAERAGLLPNDVVVDVDGVKVATLEDARRKMSGPLTEDVMVRVRRGESVEVVRVSREQVLR